MSRLTSHIITAAAVLAVLGGLGSALMAGVNRSEAAECIKWQAEAREYPDFYLTSWQAEQCAAHKIDTGATIK